jgi:hypothetical protein
LVGGRACCVPTMRKQVILPLHWLASLGDLVPVRRLPCHRHYLHGSYW